MLRRLSLAAVLAAYSAVGFAEAENTVQVKSVNNEVFDVYESEVTRAFRSIVSKDNQVIDIDANTVAIVNPRVDTGVGTRAYIDVQSYGFVCKLNGFKPRNPSAPLISNRVLFIEDEIARLYEYNSNIVIEHIRHPSTNVENHVLERVYCAKN